ncbi:MAG: phage tail tape measure protein [Pseudoruegeria sp.]
MSEFNEFDALDDIIETMGTRFADATNVASAFGDELLKMGSTLSQTSTDIGGVSRSMSGGLRNAFNDVVFDGDKLSSSLEGLAQSMSNAVYNTSIKPVADQFGGAVSGLVNGAVSAFLPFENGASFSQGRVMPFAKGGVVSGPATFSMRGGMGLMGEAGPEAIMPLQRGADGRLGVAAAGGGRPVNVVMNISTPDVDGFSRSRGQIATQMGRVLARGARNR